MTARGYSGCVHARLCSSFWQATDSEEASSANVAPALTACGLCLSCSCSCEYLHHVHRAGLFRQLSSFCYAFTVADFGLQTGGDLDAECNAPRIVAHGRDRPPTTHYYNCPVAVTTRLLPLTGYSLGGNRALQRRVATSPSFGASARCPLRHCCPRGRGLQRQ